MTGNGSWLLWANNHHAQVHWYSHSVYWNWGGIGTTGHSEVFAWHSHSLWVSWFKDLSNHLLWRFFKCARRGGEDMVSPKSKLPTNVMAQPKGWIQIYPKIIIERKPDLSSLWIVFPGFRKPGLDGAGECPGLRKGWGVARRPALDTGGMRLMGWNRPPTSSTCIRASFRWFESDIMEHSALQSGPKAIFNG